MEKLKFLPPVDQIHMKYWNQNHSELLRHRHLQPKNCPAGSAPHIAEI